MFKATARLLTLALAAASGASHAADGVVVIGHPALRQVDLETIEKIYTGKLIQVGNIFVIAVNADVGSNVRERFLQAFLKQDEGKYTGYWRVRRSIGQGKPPRELTRSIDVINFVNSTPGAIGYISEADVQPGLNVLLR
jgi:ABC-type phosphate transport system substrate-binding protein